MKIEIQNLQKKYGDNLVLKGIDLTFEGGKFYGLLGPNGAGKTTLFNLLIRTISQTSGDIKWTIDDEVVLVKDVYKHLGVVFQQNNLDDLLSIKENLMLRGQLYGLSKSEVEASIKEMDTYLDLSPILDKRYGELSGGQKRKGDIARALIHQPSILLLDEPTTALDPKTRYELWQAIRYLNREKGMMIILITHYLEEMEGCDVLNVIANGKVRYSGNIGNFITENTYTSLKLKAVNKDVAYTIARSLSYPVKTVEDEVIVTGIDMSDIMTIISTCHTNEWIEDFQVEKASLEGAYLNLLEDIESEVK